MRHVAASPQQLYSRYLLIAFMVWLGSHVSPCSIVFGIFCRALWRFRTLGATDMAWREAELLLFALWPGLPPQKVRAICAWTKIRDRIRSRRFGKLKKTKVKEGQIDMETDYTCRKDYCTWSLQKPFKDCYSGYFNWHELWSHRQLLGRFHSDSQWGVFIENARFRKKSSIQKKDFLMYLRKSYCCRYHQRGCVQQSTPAPYDCDAGVDYS